MAEVAQPEQSNHLASISGTPLDNNHPKRTIDRAVQMTPSSCLPEDASNRLPEQPAHNARQCNYSQDSEILRHLPL